MRLSLLAVALLGVVAASALSSEEEAFTTFVSKYQKSYDGVGELFKRFNVFKANLAFINGVNGRNMTYSLGINQFADLTGQEFTERYTGLKTVPRSAIMATHTVTEGVAAPDAVDWDVAGYGTHVKNQGQCGSCWAFSATGSIENAWAIAYNLTGSAVPVISEQQLVDCAGSFGNHGCNGGWMNYAFNYVIRNGICYEKDYPYTARDSACKASSCNPVPYKIRSYTDIPARNERVQLDAVAKQSVSVAVQADQMVFQFYKSGIVTSGCGTSLNHGVLAVGYGTEGGIDYWRLKNSWGATWGDKGYIRVIRDKNMCGVASVSSYANSA